VPLRIKPAARGELTRVRFVARGPRPVTDEDSRSGAVRAPDQESSAGAHPTPCRPVARYFAGILSVAFAVRLGAFPAVAVKVTLTFLPFAFAFGLNLSFA